MNILKRNNVNVVGSGDSAILFAHGFGCDQNMWRSITPLFDSSTRQILFDYVGSGQSDLNAFDIGKYSSIEGYAQDILDVCDALDLKSGVIFVGHSVSCSAGVVASLQRPELFKAIIMIGPSPCFINYPPNYTGGFEKSDLEELLALMDQNYIGWANYLAPVVAGDDGETQISGELNDSFCSTDPLVAKTFAKTTFFADNRDDFKRVESPCLILQHRVDTLAPLSVGQYLSEHIKNNTFEVLDVHGHCAHMSHPELVVQKIKEFVAAQ